MSWYLGLSGDEHINGVWYWFCPVFKQVSDTLLVCVEIHGSPRNFTLKPLFVTSPHTVQKPCVKLYVADSALLLEDENDSAAMSENNIGTTCSDHDIEILKHI